MGRTLPQHRWDGFVGAWKDFAQLRAMQDERIPEVLKRAERSPFYAGKFAGRPWPQSVEDFAELPLTTKKELQQNYPWGLLAADQEEVIGYYESSGTDGTPTPAYYNEADFEDLIERYARKATGIGPSDIFLVRTPYALGLAANLSAMAGRYCGATVLAGDLRSSVIPYPRVVRILHDVGVTLTWSTPTDPLVWAATARRRGLDPKTDFPKLRGMWVAGEPLSEARRKRISEIWGVPVIDEYGCTEVGSLAGRCPEDQLHFWADRVKPEVYEPDTGKVSAEGVGEMVLTPLHLETMPLVRYNIHDWVRLTYSECACGWNLPVVQVLGRAGGGFPIGDVRITQFQLEQLIFSLPAELGVLFWRARVQPEVLQLQIEADPALAGAVREAVTVAVDVEFGVPCEIEVLAPGGLVPDEVIHRPRQTFKPRSVFGPGEDWDQAIVVAGS
jgi:phenylacetate-CoA ligase